MPTRAGIVLHRLGVMSRSRGSDARGDESASGCVPERPRHGEHVRIVKDRSVMGRSNETKDSAICLRMDQSAEAIKRQNREGQHGENPKHEDNSIVIQTHQIFFSIRHYFSEA